VIYPPPARERAGSAVEASGAIDIVSGGYPPVVAVAHRRDSRYTPRDPGAPRSRTARARRAEIGGRHAPRRVQPEQATFLRDRVGGDCHRVFLVRLFGQFSSPISHSFARPEPPSASRHALTRLGERFAMFAIAIADRRGRRLDNLAGWSERP